MDDASGVMSKNSWPSPQSQIFSSLFSPKSVTEIIVRWRFSSLPVDGQWPRHHVLEGLSFFHQIAFAPLSKIIWDNKLGATDELWIPPNIVSSVTVIVIGNIRLGFHVLLGMHSGQDERRPDPWASWWSIF